MWLEAPPVDPGWGGNVGRFCYAARSLAASAPPESDNPARRRRSEGGRQLRLRLGQVARVDDRVAREHRPGLPAAQLHDGFDVDAGTPVGACPGAPKVVEEEPG